MQHNLYMLKVRLNPCVGCEDRCALGDLFTSPWVGAELRALPERFHKHIYQESDLSSIGGKRDVGFKNMQIAKEALEWSQAALSGPENEAVECRLFHISISTTETANSHVLSIVETELE